MAELGSTTDPVALVPGRPASVQADADALTARSEQLEAAATALSRVRTPGWSGPAADAFESEMGKQPRSWRVTADALTDAAAALTAYAGVLTTAQSDAAEAIALWAQGQTATANARAAHDRAVSAYQTSAGTPNPSPQPAPFADPGADLRAEAQRLLDDARGSVTDEGDTAAQKLGRIVVSDSAIVHNEAGTGGPSAEGSTSGSLFTVDPETGEVSLDLASAEGQAALFTADASTLAKYGQLYAKAEAGLMIGAKGEAKIGIEEWTALAEASGSVGVHGEAGASAGFDYGKVGVTASGLLGAEAEAGITLGKQGVNATVGGFAGAKGEVGAEAELAGIGAEATVDGRAGIGAEATAGVKQNPDGSWTVKVKAGLAFGLGAGGSASINVDPQGLTDAVGDAASFIGSMIPR